MRRLFHWLFCRSAIQRFDYFALLHEGRHHDWPVRCTRCGYKRRVRGAILRKAAEAEVE